MKLLVVVALLVALSATATGKVLFNRQSHPQEWALQGRADPTTKVSFIVALQQHNLDKLEQIFWAVSDPKGPQYQNFLSNDEITAIVAPPKADHDRVLGWLRAAGCHNTVSHGDSIEVETTVAVAEGLLNTVFYNYQHKTSSVAIVRQYGEYSVPETVAPLIHLIAGVSDFPVPRTEPKIKTDVAAQAIGIVPQTVQSSYGTPSSASASHNSSQGVIEFEGQYYSPSDLQSFATGCGLQITTPSDTHTVGSNSPSSPGTEAELDIQYIAGVGLGIENWFWIEAGGVWVYGWAVHFHSSATVPLVVSVSYGWSEAAQCKSGIGGQECQQIGVDSQAYVQRTNTEFMKIGLRGVSIMVASGDSGTNGRSDSLCFSQQFFPSYPASSPYVTAVGATQLNSPSALANPPAICNGITTCASEGTEVAVSYSQAHFASGGGFSNVAPTPSYQKSVVSTYLSTGPSMPPASYYNRTGRGFPDVASFGSDILIKTGGKTATVGGTSAAAPIFAGVMALLNADSLAASGKPLGFLNPLLYGFSNEAFTDITSGNNKCTERGCGFFGSCKGFTAAKGWDPVTGLGSPVYPSMKSQLSDLFAARARAFE